MQKQSSARQVCPVEGRGQAFCGLGVENLLCCAPCHGTCHDVLCCSCGVMGMRAVFGVWTLADNKGDVADSAEEQPYCALLDKWGSVAEAFWS